LQNESIRPTPLTEHELDRQLPDFYPRIHRMVRSMVYGTGLDAEDLTQDSFLKVYNKRHLYNGSSSLYTWTYQIARNTVLDALRRDKLQRRIFWWNEAETEPDDYRASESGDDALDRREQHRLLRTAMSQLADKDRLIITMRDLEGMSYDEIADVENLAVGTVKSRLFTARQRLKDELIKLGMSPESEE
jgi:RNA polymerase sigma-70 factor, ECF subfamily